jgi:hypothetical protein
MGIYIKMRGPLFVVVVFCIHLFHGDGTVMVPGGDEFYLYTFIHFNISFYLLFSQKTCS